VFNCIRGIHPVYWAYIGHNFMARAVKDTKLDTRNARLKLAKRSKPYWRTISEGRHIGYRRNKDTGTWCARLFIGDGQYNECRLGNADDHMDSDGVNILSFGEAQEAARLWFERHSLSDEEYDRLRSGPYKLRDAADDYLTWFKSEKKSYKETKRVIDTYIISTLGNVEVNKLSTQRIRKWRNDIWQEKAQLRTAKASTEKNYRDDNLDDEEIIRKRKATANRILTVLKAVLNHAYQHRNDIISDNAWRKVKAFRNVDKPRVRFLSENECNRLLNACPSDFRKLVHAALLTGCRYGELVTATCAYYNAEAGTLYVPARKTSKARHIPLTQEGVDLFDKLTMGKQSDDLIFLRSDNQKWGRSHQERRIKDAAQATKIEDVSFHVLRHTYASMLAKQGVPMMMIATALGHSDTRMAERHYAHLAPSHVADTIRANLPTFAAPEKDNVVRIGK